MVLQNILLLQLALRTCELQLLQPVLPEEGGGREGGGESDG
jgi:hypothetical protein